MSSQEIWKEISFILSVNINQNINERDFESQVVRAIEKLDWLEYKGEIARQPTLHFGRGTLRPDVVIYDEEKRPIIVVEIKRPLEDISKENSIGQLHSYMKQMKADLGWLVGNEIRTYYDGNLNPHPSAPLLLEKISFDGTSTLGVNFVNVFSKNNFLAGEHINYIKNKIGKYNEEREVKKLRRNLLSEDTKLRIHKFLESEYSDFGSDVFLKAIKNIQIELTSNQPPQPEPSVAIHQYQKKKKTIVKPTPNVNTNISGKTFNLEDLKQESLDKYAKPYSLEINEESIPVKNWTELTITFVEWLINTEILSTENIPVLSYSENEKYFINSKRCHKIAEKKAQWKKVGDFYVDTKYNADGHKRNIIKTFDELKVKANIKITFA